jgi:hypothetical protein
LVNYWDYALEMLILASLYHVPSPVIWFILRWLYLFTHDLNVGFAFSFLLELLTDSDEIVGFGGKFNGVDHYFFQHAPCPCAS